jgi:ribose transport system substrate-binding protein
MRQLPIAGRLGRRRGKLGVAALSALALTVVGGVGAGASTNTTEPAGTEPVGSAPSGSAAEGGGDFVIGVSNTLAGNGWREEMICSVKAQSLASGQVSEVIAISRNGGPTEQIQDLQNLISQGVDAIIVNPSDREQLNPVIEEAIAQGIVVVAVDQAVTAEGAYVATNDQVEYGRLGGQWLADALGGAGSVLYMRGIEGVPADDDRNTGFSEVMAEYPDIELKEVYSGWDYAQGGDIAVQELTASDYDGIWTSGIDYTVVNAFDTVGKDPVPVVGADNNEFIHQLIEGQPGALVTNPAVIGAVGTQIALDALTGQEPEQVTTLTPQLWDLENNQAELEENYFPDRDATFSSAVTIEGYTNYTPEQLFECKGPGE